MEFFSHPIVAVILLLGVLVIVHETGHFLVGKLCNIPVEIFSIGFGPTLIGFRRGETEYRLSAIPLGGFVKFYGSVPSDEVPPELKGREFFRASVPKRLITIAAGPISNFFLAVFVFAGMVMYGIQQPPALVGEIVPGSPAERAGFQFGDHIKAIDGQPVKSWKDVQRLIGDRPKQDLQIKLERAQGLVDLKLAPEEVQDEDMPGTRGRIGISRFMVPSVLTRVNDQGFISQAGLVTGDRLLSVAWNGISVEIKYWRQFLNFLQTYAASPNKPTSLMLKVSTYVPDAEEKGQQAPASVRDLELRIPAEWTYQADTFEATTGISHAQLTVYRVEDPIKGLERGDQIKKINGTKVDGAFELGQALTNYASPKAKIGILRAGVEQEVEVELKPVEVQKAQGKTFVYTLPVVFWGNLEQPDWIEERYSNPLTALAYGFSESIDLTKSIGKAIGGLFTGEMPLAALGGPIAIAKVASESVKIGWQAFAHALALISINLALLNLVPIPVLDGGQLVLVSAEAVIRRPVREATIENYQKVGFVMVLALFVIATYNDLGRFWASMLRGVSTMF